MTKIVLDTRLEWLEIKDRKAHVAHKQSAQKCADRSSMSENFQKL